MHCAFCQKKPDEIPEYIEAAKYHEMTPQEYVRMDEGTYHHGTDLFCCTECYIKIGMPLNANLHVAFKMYRQTVVPLATKK